MLLTPETSLLALQLVRCVCKWFPGSVPVSNEQKGEWKGRTNPMAGCFASLPRGKWFPGSLGSLFEHFHGHIHSRAASDSIQDFDHQRTLGFSSALGIEKTRERSVKLIRVRGLVLSGVRIWNKPKSTC